MQVASTGSFSLGSPVDIDPGTAVHEVNTIQAFGSIIFGSPLKFAHAAGAVISQVAKAKAPTVSAPVDASCPILPSLENRTTITGSLEISLLAAQPVGHMEEVMTSFNVQYELFTSNKMLIAKRVNSYFWTSDATIYDCHDKKIYELQYKWSLSGAMGSPETMISHPWRRHSTHARLCLDRAVPTIFIIESRFDRAAPP